MLKNITFSVKAELIESARKKAQRQHTTLNNQFRQWLEQYVNTGQNSNSYDSLMESLSYAQSNQHFSRDEMNER